VCALMGKYATKWKAGFEPRYAKALISTVLAFIGTSVVWLAFHLTGGTGAPWDSIYALLGCGLLTCSNVFLLKSEAGNPPGVGKSIVIAVCQVVCASIFLWFLQSCFVLSGRPLM